MRKFFSRIENKRLGGIGALALVLMLISAGIFGFGHGASADILGYAFNAIGSTASEIVGGLVAWLVQTIGWMLLNFIWVLLAVGNYNQFLASTAVTTGWVVVRDFVNMFFVLVLLAIAIGTILQQQQYHYSQTLPKFLAAAILVNFSKTICGIAIDATQVVMMTFMGAISAAGGGNFAVLIGLHGLLKHVGTTSSPIDGTAAATGMLLAFFYVVVAFIVVVIMVVMLVIRIVALWFLIILSPAAFFLMALPNDRGYFSKWQEQFISYLLLGPVMAFFLWLSLTVVATQSEGINDGSLVYIGTELGLDLRNREGWTGAVQFGELGGSLIGSLGGTTSYILGIVMLLGSLMAAQQLSSVGGSIAGAGASFAKDWMAGKRGPFSPFRGLRERGAAYMKIRRQAREEKVARDAGRIADVVGFAKTIIPSGVRALGRTAMAEIPGLGAAEQGLRQAAHFVTVPWRNFVDTTKGENERGARVERALAAQAFETAEQEGRSGNHGAAATARQAARRHLGRAEWLDLSVKGKSLAAEAPKIGLEIGKAFLAASTGLNPVGGMLAYGPGAMRGLERGGREQGLASQQAYGRAMSGFMRNMQELIVGDDTSAVRAVAEGTAPGYTDMERAAAMRVLARRPEANGGYGNGELDIMEQRYIALINAVPIEIAGWRRDIDARPTGLPAAPTAADAATAAAIAAAVRAAMGGP